MLMKPECVTCILNQIIRIIDHSSIKEMNKDEIFRKALNLAAKLDYTVFLPPLYSEKFYNSVSELSGDPDPYKSIRKSQNDLIMGKESLFTNRIESSSDPLFTSLYYSLLGNIIDYGGVEIFRFDHLFDENIDMDIAVNDYRILKNRLGKAKKILVIADNAGEAVFDRMFLRQLKIFNPEIKIFYGVKSGPAINDVMYEDAKYIGIDDFAEIVETGSTYAGTVIETSLPEFRELFEESDVVISKGQGNFETLETENNRDVFFVFKVKCKVVSEFTGLGKGSLVMAFGNSLKRL